MRLSRTVIYLLAALIVSAGLAAPASAASKKKAEYNKKKGEEFLAKNKEAPGVVTTRSGLQYKVLKEGKGPSPKRSSQVMTHYKGTLLGGRVFDSSYKRRQPAVFRVDGVIDGWTEALLLMRAGGKWKLFVPPELAYGERGDGKKVGPNATLIFEVELLRVR